MFNFLYINSPAGSGKTFSIITTAISNIYTKAEQYIFAVPTRALSSQYVETAKSMGFDLIEVNSTSSSSSVFELFSEEVSKNSKGIVITHEFLQSLLLDHSIDLSSYNLIIDEIPSIHKIEKVNIVKHQDLIKNHLEVSSTITKFNLPVVNVIKNKITCSKTEVTSDDIGKTGISNIYKMVLNKNIDTVCLENFDSTKNFTIAGVVNPTVYSKFKTSTIMSAFFKESLFYKMYSKQYGVNFIEQKIKTRYADHSHVKNLEIHYFIESDFSKSKRFSSSMSMRSKDDLMTEILRETNKVLGNEKAIVILNNDISPVSDTSKYSHRKNVVDILGNQEYISSFSHGLNQYQNINHTAFLSSINMDQITRSFFEKCEFDSNEVDEFFLFSSLYQSVMRSSLRNPSNTETKKIVVVDKRSAVYLADKFGIKHTDLIKHDAKEKQSFIDKGYQVLKSAEKRRFNTNASRLLSKIKRDCINLKENPIKHNSFVLFNGLKTYTHDIFDYKDSNGLLSEIKNCAITQKSHNKHDGFLVQYSVLKETKIGQYSEASNIAVNALSFDCDKIKAGGIELTLEKAMEYFTKKDIRCIGYDTHSGGYRIVIPLKHQITKEAAELFYNHINNDLGEHGYRQDFNSFGPFDTSKFNGASKFYLPNSKPGTNCLVLDNYDVTSDFNFLSYARDTHLSITFKLYEKFKTKIATPTELEEVIQRPKPTISLPSNKIEEKIQSEKSRFLSNPCNRSMTRLIANLVKYQSDSEIISWIRSNYRNRTGNSVSEAKSMIRYFRNKQYDTTSITSNVHNREIIESEIRKANPKNNKGSMAERFARILLRNSVQY